MKIGINASFIRKPDSGIGQVSANFLKALIAETVKDPETFAGLEFVIYLEQELDWELPENFQKKVLKTFYRRDDLVRKIIWEKWLLPRAIAKDGCKTLFSLYQSPTVLKKARHVMLVHDTIWKIFPQYLNNFRKKIYYHLVEKGIQRADEIVTISQHSKQDIKRFFAVEAEKIQVFPIDCDPIFKKAVSPQKKTEVLSKFRLEEGKYLFYVGGFDLRKNVDALLRAYGILYTRHSSKMEIPRLILAGAFHSSLVPLVSDIPNIAEEVMQKNGIPRGYIESLGFVAQEDLPAIYAGAKLFCYPSKYEGFGLPVLEAMNAGCPVVTSNSSSLGEIASESEVVAVDVGSEEKLAEGIASLLVNGELAEEKIQKAKQKAGQFSWRNFTKNTLNLLTKSKNEF